MSGFQTAEEYAAALHAIHDEYRQGRVTLREHLLRSTSLWSEILKRDLVDQVQAAIDRCEDG
ncbi:MAG: hypothetical protein WB493_18595 [Anaeromyxobacteraceae bacterium]